MDQHATEQKGTVERGGNTNSRDEGQNGGRLLEIRNMAQIEGKGTQGENKMDTEANFQEGKPGILENW